MKLSKFTQPINHTVEKLKFADSMWDKLKEYKEFYEEVYGHKIEDVTGKQDAMSLFIEKMLESFMKEDKEFAKKQKENKSKVVKEEKAVVSSSKNEKQTTSSSNSTVIPEFKTTNSGFSSGISSSPVAKELTGEA